MKINLRSIVTLLAATATCAIAFADDLTDFKKWYAKDLPIMIKAMESKNLAYFNKCSTADFTYTEASGKTAKKKESMAGLKQMMDGTESIKYKTKVASTKAVKGTMVVDLLNEYTMVLKAPPGGKKSTMWMKSKSRETWVKSGGKWLLKNITDIGTPEVKMDGQKVSG